MTVQEDGDALVWVCNAAGEGESKSFVHAIAIAALRADDFNYPILRPVILQMMEKYPQYL